MAYKAKQWATETVKEKRNNGFHKQCMAYKIND